MRIFNPIQIDRLILSALGTVGSIDLRLVKKISHPVSHDHKPHNRDQ